jgi:hypothetical protein
MRCVFIFQKRGKKPKTYIFVKLLKQDVADVKPIGDAIIQKKIK